MCSHPSYRNRLGWELASRNLLSCLLTFYFLLLGKFQSLGNLFCNLRQDRASLLRTLSWFLCSPVDKAMVFGFLDYEQASIDGSKKT